MNGMKRHWASIFKKNLFTMNEVNSEVCADIAEALIRWDEARMCFEEAVGADEVDYAIYMLEAAELKYQIHLKRAKALGINRGPSPKRKHAIRSNVDHSV